MDFIENLKLTMTVLNELNQRALDLPAEADRIMPDWMMNNGMNFFKDVLSTHQEVYKHDHSAAIGEKIERYQAKIKVLKEMDIKDQLMNLYIVQNSPHFNSVRKLKRSW